MNILVTLNENYMHPLKVMLKSLFLNNPGEQFAIYFMHSGIPQHQLDQLGEWIAKHQGRLELIHVRDDHFADAPVLLHYTKEMYYRLLASKFLPEKLDKILYLDPDILVINRIHSLYEMDLQDHMYAAAYHDKISVREINRIRLLPYEIRNYYNSGVLLMNLDLQRELIDEQAIYRFVGKHRSRLIMPDQDILNALYGKYIKNVDEILYNYDARFYSYYKLKTNGRCDMDFIINHTVFLHFCGKKKPWKKDYGGRFHALYKHYEKLTIQDFQRDT